EHLHGLSPTPSEDP
ncbi:hypothetical protein RRG08_059547, partial [Elysia crispata]